MATSLFVKNDFVYWINFSTIYSLDSSTEESALNVILSSQQSTRICNLSLTWAPTVYLSLDGFLYTTKWLFFPIKFSSLNYVFNEYPEQLNISVSFNPKTSSNVLNFFSTN